MNEHDCDPGSCRQIMAPDGPALPLDETEQGLAELCKALGHPARIRIMNILSAQTSCVCCDIASQIPLAQSTISQHLKQLKTVGLIQGEIDGTHICYGIDAQRLEQFQGLLAQFFEHRSLFDE